MDEDTWLNTQNLNELLTHPDIFDHRKRRLLLCACSRRLLNSLADTRFKHAIDATEEYADQRVTWEELKTNARRAAIEARNALTASRPGGRIHDAAVAVVATTAKFMYWDVLTSARLALANTQGRYEQEVERTEEMAQVQLLRDIFGNPFRPVTFSSSWRTSTAISLARGMYESRDFSAMPILADALQDAGCDNDDILTHCRNPKQVHVRGCWVIDLVLGRK